MAKAVTITGDKALVRALNNIGPAINRRVIKGAANAAMSPVNKDAKRRLKANKRTGQLWRSIGKKSKSYASKGLVWVGVGPRDGFAIDTEEFGRVNPVNYAHLVELGTQTVAAQPFLRPALDSKAAEVKQIRGVKLWAGIKREAEKARRKGGK